MKMYHIKFFAKGEYFTQKVYANTPKEAFVELKRVAKSQSIPVAIHGIVDLHSKFSMQVVA